MSGRGRAILGSLLLAFACALAGALYGRASGQGAPALSGAGQERLSELRHSYLEYWRELEEGGVTGLERFARTVQRVVDTRAADRDSGGPDPVRLVLDDLVDLFVSAEFALEKRLLMSTPSVLGEAALSESPGDLEGFAPRFLEGEGRFRHFVLNAAASYAAPGALVDLLARLRGGDLSSGSGDSAADLATNRVGREFTRLLLQEPIEELAGGRIASWIVKRFGSR